MKWRKGNYCTLIQKFCYVYVHPKEIISVYQKYIFPVMFLFVQRCAYFLKDRVTGLEDGVDR